jgi:hypothetical protein
MSTITDGNIIGHGQSITLDILSITGDRTKYKVGLDSDIATVKAAICNHLNGTGEESSTTTAEGVVPTAKANFAIEEIRLYVSI